MNQCDHGHDTSEEIRALPLGENGNVLYCHTHWKEELNYRKRVFNELQQKPSDFPEWSSLKVTSPSV